MKDALFCVVFKIGIQLRGKASNLDQLLMQYAENFDRIAVLQSHEYKDKYGKYEFIAAFGCARNLDVDENSFQLLKEFIDEKKSWLFGHFSYDLKNQIENIQSSHQKKFDFPLLSFFEPEKVLLQKRGSSQIEFWSQHNSDEDFLKFFNQNASDEYKFNPLLPKLDARQSKLEYCEVIGKLKEEIQYGNIYEINYCQEFYAENCELDVPNISHLIQKNNPMPFSAYYKLEDNHLFCASPERFICKRGNTLISQPIKGTAKRGIFPEEDENIKSSLKEDLKEQTENVMIVDLVRNDLSKTATKGSVNVEELFGVYTFPTVHQLISTVTSELDSKYHIIDAIKHAFPMGSMTGAPKISAMQIADKYEKFRRELYSGSIGYIDPEGDFDFNVVIRSLSYSAKSKYLSLGVGGAITILSEAEKEYDECLLKAKAIFGLQKV